MAGVYTENQPDFTWLMPYEEKQFTQYFMPYRELGVVKQASKDFVLNIESLPPTLSEERGRLVTFKVLATSKQEVCIVLRNKKGEEYYNKVVTLSPEEVFEQTVDIKGATLNDLELSILPSPFTPHHYYGMPRKMRFVLFPMLPRPRSLRKRQRPMTSSTLRVCTWSSIVTLRGVPSTIMRRRCAAIPMMCAA